jgi:23S rRNA (cytidine2498-2'-O)-methyltransferase
MILSTCQSGYEAILARELAARGARVAGQGRGWVLAEPAVGFAPASLVFAHLTLESPRTVAEPSVNGLAHALVEAFAAGIRDEKITEPWCCWFAAAGEPEGLGPRVASVEKAFHEILRRKLGRISRLSSPHLPRGVGPTPGFFVWFTDFGQAAVARAAERHGPRRMADDPLAPSRSYLKVEEAYGVLGAEPQAGESVCDLGAAPGGWSYSAARRGARVTAVDNGPLKGGALNHPQIEHRRQDAFAFAPPAGTPFDWLFCDMVEEPHHVLRSIVEPWLARGWCGRFVVNFKLGRVEPIALVDELRAAGSPLPLHAPGFRLTHLYHDRDEITATGSVRTPAAGPRR